MASTNITGLGVLEPIPRGQDMIGSSVYTYSEAKAVGGEGGWVGGGGGGLGGGQGRNLNSKKCN